MREEMTYEAAAGYGLSRKPTLWETLTSERYFKWTLLIPLIVLLGIFMVYPLLYCAYYSFHQWECAGMLST